MAMAAGAHANLLLDGDFEGLTTGWANGATPFSAGAWTFYHEGGVFNQGGSLGLAARLESNGSASSDPTAQQTVSGLTIGATYALAWDVAIKVPFSGATNGPSFGVFLDTQSFGTALKLAYSASYTTTYKHELVEFVATNTSHTFIFAGELDGRTNGALPNATTDISYKLDNVSLNPVPEPGSMAMVAFAGSSIAAAYRRRRIKA